MAGALFSTVNYVAGATSVTVTNRDTSTPASYICDGRLLTVLRANAADVPLIIKGDFGASKSVRAFFLGELNLPAGASVRFCLSNTSENAQEIEDHTETGIDITGDGTRKQVVYYLATAKNARYFRIEIETGSSSGVTLEAGWLWIGGADFEPDSGLEYGARFGYNSRTLTQQARSGVEYHDVLRGQYQWTFTFRILSDAEALQDALDIDAAIDVYNPILFVPHKHSTNTNLNRETLLGKFVQVDPVEQWNDDLAAKTYVLREALSAEVTVAWA